MPPIGKRQGLLNLKSVIQLIAGTVFMGLGIFILVTKFENNYVLVGLKKQLFGGILCIYGIVRLVRIYLGWRAQKNYYYEDTES